MTWAYEMTANELVDEFSRAMRRAGLSGSGLVIDPMAYGDAREATYFKGAVLARLEGLRPPFRPGDKVMPVAPQKGRGLPYHTTEPLIVERIYYKGNRLKKEGEWELVFKRVSSPEYSIGYPSELFTSYVPEGVSSEYSAA